MMAGQTSEILLLTFLLLPWLSNISLNPRYMLFLKEEPHLLLSSIIRNIYIFFIIQLSLHLSCCYSEFPLNRNFNPIILTILPVQYTALECQMEALQHSLDDGIIGTGYLWHESILYPLYGILSFGGKMT